MSWKQESDADRLKKFMALQSNVDVSPAYYRATGEGGPRMESGNEERQQVNSPAVAKVANPSEHAPSAGAKRFCTQCGYNVIGAKFCGGCGAKVSI